MVCNVQQSFSGNEASTCTSSACYTEVEFAINSGSNSPLLVGNAAYVALTTSLFQARHNASAGYRPVLLHTCLSPKRKNLTKMGALLPTYKAANS